MIKSFIAWDLLNENNCNLIQNENTETFKKVFRLNFEKQRESLKEATVTRGARIKFAWLRTSSLLNEHSEGNVVPPYVLLAGSEAHRLRDPEVLSKVVAFDAFPEIV